MQYHFLVSRYCYPTVQAIAQRVGTCELALDML